MNHVWELKRCFYFILMVVAAASISSCISFPAATSSTVPPGTIVTYNQMSANPSKYSGADIIVVVNFYTIGWGSIFGPERNGYKVISVRNPDSLQASANQDANLLWAYIPVDKMPVLEAAEAGTKLKLNCGTVFNMSLDKWGYYALLCSDVEIVTE